jgi:hypothetical protein
MHFQDIPFWNRSFRVPKTSSPSPAANQSAMDSLAKAALSRRRFLGTFASTAGLGLGSSLGFPTLARAVRPSLRELSSPDSDDGPQHLPGGISTGKELPSCPSQLAVAHFFGPGAMNENSSIWDFDGYIGVAAGLVNGTGSLAGTPQSFTGVHVDMRFMSGRYIGLDGLVHRGAFVFI